MSECILIAIVGAFINMILALFIPCLLNNTKMPIFTNIKKVYATHKQAIITSSVIVFVTIYLALKITPQLGLSLNNNNTYENSSRDSDINSMFNSIGTTPDRNSIRVINLSNLSRL